MASDTLSHKLIVMFPECYRKYKCALGIFWGNLEIYQSDEWGITPVIYLDQRRLGENVLEAPITIEPISSPQNELCLVLDARAIVFDETEGTVPYGPRTGPTLELHSEPIRVWLNEHPNWGIPGCELDWDNAIAPAEA